MKNKVVEHQSEMIEIIEKCDVCYVSMVDAENKPYVIPMNFGFHNNTILLHSAKHGKKIDILRNNPNVCVVFSTDHQLRWQHEQVACSWSMKYRSVVAYGKVVFIDDLAEKEKYLVEFMKNYSGNSFKFSKPSLVEVQVFTIAVDKMEGRVYGY